MNKKYLKPPPSQCFPNSGCPKLLKQLHSVNTAGRCKGNFIICPFCQVFGGVKFMSPSPGITLGGYPKIMKKIMEKSMSLICSHLIFHCFFVKDPHKRCQSMDRSVSDSAFFRCCFLFPPSNNHTCIVHIWKYKIL